MNNIEQLSRIYNTLLLVNTKGEDTIVMAECLNALKNFVITMQQEAQNKTEEE